MELDPSRRERDGTPGRAVLCADQRAQIMALANDFPRLWNNPQAADRERKRMARLLIEDVTLLKAADITARVRFKGGAARTLSVPLPKPAWMARKTPSEVVTAIDQLLDGHTDVPIAKLLNEHGLVSGEGKRFHPEMVGKIRDAYKLRSRYERLRERGLLDLGEIARRLDVGPSTVRYWHRAGLLIGHPFNDKGQCLFEPPGANAPVKYKHQHKTRGTIAVVA
jgi:hypothetical protein